MRAARCLPLPSREGAGGKASALIVFGPTASGKSALAIELAQRVQGVIVNADSMQLYRELRVLTARPTPEDEARAPHSLYGVRPAAEPSSAAWWREAALAEMARARGQGRVPILCGGTGLYLAALTGGLAPIPDPGPEARAEARALLAELGPADLHARLSEADPETASRLHPADSQRIARAWEVWRGTGRGLASWQSIRDAPAPEWRFLAVLIDPPRTELRAAIAARFGAMLQAGAVEEVRALLRLGLDPALPAMRAHGVREIAACLQGAIPLEEAARRAIVATGQYAKRQATWLRHHPFAPTHRTHMIHARAASPAQFLGCLTGPLEHFLRGTG